MKYSAFTLPVVHPMMIREVHSVEPWYEFRDKLISQKVTVREIGMAEHRLDFDEKVVDISNAMLELTTMACRGKGGVSMMIFTSRRWRNHRIGNECSRATEDEPLLFIGNPVRMWVAEGGAVTVQRIPEYLIKSGTRVMMERE